MSIPIPRNAVAPVLTMAAAVTLCVGCTGSNKRVPVLAMSLVSARWKEEITFFTDSTACCEFQHEADSEGSRRTFCRSYDVACEPRKLEDLLTISNYLSRFVAPMREGSLPNLVFRLSHKGGQTAVVEVDRVQYENAPIWRGLADQCRVIANADLFRAMASREFAETLASSGELEIAAHLYADAVTRLVVWIHRKLLAQPPGMIDDSGRYALGAQESLEKKPPGIVVDYCRQSWFELCVSIFIPPPGSHSEPRPATWGDPAPRFEIGSQPVSPASRPHGGER